jgi:hypothetical protein
MKKKKLTKKECEEINLKWKMKNGCSNFDFKEKNMIIYDGGLFPICEKEVMRNKVLGTKKIKFDFNGKETNGYKVIFSKKKYKDKENYVVIWFSELRETIEHLQRAEKLLKKLGYNTDWRKK